MPAKARAAFGYRKFTDGATRFRLARWLYALCWTDTDRPSVLFDRATAWLVTEKVLLPGPSALERLVASIRARAPQRLCHSFTHGIAHAQRERLDALLLSFREQVTSKAGIHSAHSQILTFH